MATLKVAVASASCEKVLDAGARLGVANGAFPFLGHTSSLLDYAAQPFIVRRLQAAPTVSDKAEFADYLAIATACHCLDGWRYLAKAAYSLLNGSRNAAIHLAYYAELRAAKSLLASAGVGILNSLHFSVDNNGNVLDFGGRTHVAVWDALKEWASIPANGERILQGIGTNGYSADTWADSCKLSLNRTDIAGGWLADWSCDLRRFRDDSGVRNTASYSANLCADAYSPPAAEELNLIRDIGDACISQTTGRTDGLDRALIHDLCSKAARLTLARPVAASDPRLWKHMRAWFQHQEGLSPTGAQDLVDEIASVPAASVNTILVNAKTSNKDVKGVTCRALLLLRLAMAQMEWQWKEIRLRAAGGRSAWQETLLVNFAENCNFLPPGSTPPSWVDLSQDHQDAIDELDDWLAAGFSAFDLWRTFPAQLREICRLERIALWVAAP